MISFQHLVIEPPAHPLPWVTFHIHPSGVARPGDLLYLLTHGPMLEAPASPRVGTRGPLPGEGGRPRKYFEDVKKAGGARVQSITMRKCRVCRETKPMKAFPSLNGVAQKATTCKTCVKKGEKK